LLQNIKALDGIYPTGIIRRRLGMKRSLTALFCSYFLIGVALADQGVIDKTESAIERGAEATARGIKRGAEAAGHATTVKVGATVVETAADVTAAGVKAAIGSDDDKDKK
jgi:hypothetical protein